MGTQTNRLKDTKTNIKTDVHVYKNIFTNLRENIVYMELTSIHAQIPCLAWPCNVYGIDTNLRANIVFSSTLR